MLCLETSVQAAMNRDNTQRENGITPTASIGEPEEKAEEESPYRLVLGLYGFGQPDLGVARPVVNG